MDIKTALTARRSVHDFNSGKEISLEILRGIFELVLLTPSSYNLQPVEFLLVTDKKLKEKVKEASYG